MKLSTGKVAFPIEFDNGDKAVIYFNPNDRGIQERIKAFENSVEVRIKNIDLEKYKDKFVSDVSIDIEHPEKLLELSADELSSLQEKLSAVNDIEKEYNQAIKDELDVVFDSKISDVVFRYCQPFDAVIVTDDDGNDTREMYVMHFMRWLMTELKRYGLQNKTAIEKHIGKHTK